MTISKKAIPYILVAPALIIYIVISFIPLVGVFKLSFFRTNFVREQYVGLRNYVKLFSDPAFLTVLWNSCIYVFLGVPIGTTIAVAFALFIFNTSSRWQTYARTMVYLPGFLGVIILSATWRWVWHPEVGLINSMLKMDIPWFSTRWTSIVPIIVSAMITGWGGSLIYYSAALATVSPEVIDAAKVDGATWGQIRRHILLPSIYKVIVLMVLLGTSGWFQQFYWIELLAPYDYAGTVMWKMYNVAFKFSKYGLGSAYSVVLMFIILAIVMVQRYAMRRKA